MKLNLLPVGASRGSTAKYGIAAGVLVALGGVVVASMLISKSNQDLKDSTDAVTTNKPKAEQAVTVANSADTIISKAQGIILNINLADAMNAHNAVYPDFYDQVKQYIPNYFRITTLTAIPNDANTSTVTMNGVIHTYQQYADLMLALLRIPGSQAVSRNGYQLNDSYIPPLIKDDQVGRRVEPGKPRLTDKPMDRLDALIASAHETGFTGTGGFGGTEIPRVRGAMPEWSAITVAVVVTKNLTTPDPRATLAGAGAAFGAAGGGAAAAPAAPAGRGAAG